VDHKYNIPYGYNCYSTIVCDGIIETSLCKYYQLTQDGIAVCNFLRTDEFDSSLNEKIKICDMNLIDSEVEVKEICYICLNPIDPYFDKDLGICEVCYKLGLGK
jgi:hypothetical protein